MPASAASYKPFPYNQQDYHQVKLLLVAEAPDSRHLGAVFLQRMDELGDQADTDHLLVLSVGGDSLSAIISMQERTPLSRPVALSLLWKVKFCSHSLAAVCFAMQDLLWLNLVVLQVLQRGQEISNRDWKLTRVAIVDMRSFTYIGICDLRP